MNKAILTAVTAAIFAGSLLASPASAYQKKTVDAQPVNPNASTNIAAKPKGPSKKIVVKKYDANGNLIYEKTCTGKGQQHCAGN